MRAHWKSAIDWLERSNVVDSVSMSHCTGCRVRQQRVDDACSKVSSSSFSSSSPSLKWAVSYQPSSTPPSGTIPSIILNPTQSNTYPTNLPGLCPTTPSICCVPVPATPWRHRRRGLQRRDGHPATIHHSRPARTARSDRCAANGKLSDPTRTTAWGRSLPAYFKPGIGVPWVMGNGNDKLCSVRGPLHDNIFIPNYF